MMPSYKTIGVIALVALVAVFIWNKIIGPKIGIQL